MTAAVAKTVALPGTGDQMPTVALGTWTVWEVGDDDDVEIHVLGCRVDTLGINCNRLLKKLKISGEGEGGGSLQLQYV